MAAAVVIFGAMCLFGVALAGGLSSADKKQIVDDHNNYRSGVKPAAANMVKMYWNDDIARYAQKYADTCPDGHDTGNARKEGTGLGIGIGQNLAWGYRSWAAAVKGWYDEVVDFRMGQGSINGKAVGHYTQVVRHHAIGIGCGFKNCPGTKYGTYYVCNYAYAQMDFKTPYTTGRSCSACPSNCKNKLCDCGSKICKNGGKLNLGTCKCDCAGPFSGATCDTANCGADPSYCGKNQPYGYPKSFCSKYSNVPNECPKMCGIC